MNAIRIITVCCMIAALYTCSPDGGFEVTNGKVTGKIYDKGGSPAEGATVHLVASTYNPYNVSNAFSDSTVTDASGSYQLDIPQSGYYNLFAQKDEKRCYLDSVFIGNSETGKYMNDTLELPGSCRGIVRLEAHESDNGSVIILVLGTNTYTMPDDASGSYSLPSMASGTYNIRILTTEPDYAVKDTTFVLPEAGSSVIADTIILEYTGISKVGPVSAVYDTSRAAITLSWSGAADGDIAGYHVYRIENGSRLLVGEPAAPESTFTDLLVSASGETIRYVVSAVKYTTEEGGYSDTVAIVASPVLELLDSITFAELEPTRSVWDVKTGPGGLLYIADGGTIRKYDSTGTQLKQSIPAEGLTGTKQDLCISGSGDVYHFTGVGTDRIIRMNSDLEQLGELYVVPGSFYMNSGLTIGPDGTLYYFANDNTNGTVVIAVSADLVETGRWKSDDFFGDLKVLTDTMIGTNYLYNGTTSLNYYTAGLTPAGTRVVDEGLSLYRPVSERQYESIYFRDENSISLLFSGSNMGPYNESDSAVTVLFFGSDNTMIARCPLAGRAVSFTSDGILSWFSGNKLYRYRIHAKG